MPTVSVGRDLLFKLLGETYTDDEFDGLCFEFGIELDDVTTEKAIIRKEKHIEGDDEEGEEEIIYKIEVPANRYDLLCVEGIARALRVFSGKEDIPIFKCIDIPSGSMIKMHVKPETKLIRPFIVCAVLRGITFTEATYKSFIDLQDKLHENICRKRTLVAIGTHDLDTIQGPFSYEALPPTEINFVPLKQEKSFRADELLNYYKSDLKLKKFLHIIEDSDVYPVIYDSNRTVLSLPPIINGAHSAISLKTKNVFIECTATDLTKAKVVLNTMVTMFSECCERKYECEPVEVVYPDQRTLEVDSFEGVESRASIYPDLSMSKFEVPVSVIVEPIGISLTAKEVIAFLGKMQLRAEESAVGDIVVFVPPTRSDILHPCDLTEDVAIAFGYNNIPKSKPQCMTTGGRQPLNKFADMIRVEVYGAGYMEVLTWILCSHEENFAMIKREDRGDQAVIISNPRSSEFEAVRTNLMSGLLKALKHNVDHPKPIKIFEVGDVVLLDKARDVGASNNRRVAALYCNSECSGFEDIMGLAKRIMDRTVGTEGYNVKPSYEREFFPNRQCSIHMKDKQIGIFGLVDPEILKNFGIRNPCSFMELDIQSVLAVMLGQSN